MTISLKHIFTSPIADAGDADLVGPDEWNDEHVLTLDGVNLLGKPDSGSGAATEIPEATLKTAFNLVGLTDSQTLTNKTLISPIINTSISGTAILDEDNLTSDSATQVATQQSIKAYVDNRASISVLDFGADKTGVADSATAFTNAIAALPSSGGVIVVPGGTYLILSTVTVNKPAKFIGEGRDVTHTDTGASIVKTSSQTIDIFNIEANNVQFEKLSISGAGSRQAPGQGKALVYCSDVITVTDGAITSGTAAFSSATGGLTGQAGNTILVAGAGAAGVGLQTTILSVSDDNNATLNTNASTTVSGATASWGTTYEGFTVTDCSFTNHAIGIDIQAGQNSLISNNDISTYDSIRVRNLINGDAGEHIIESNFLSADSSAGKIVHWLSGGGLRIHDNKMLDGQWDVYIDWSQTTSGGPQILGNSHENGTGFIFITGDGTVNLQNWVIGDNIFNGSSSGIDFDNTAGTGWCKNLHIAGNTISSSAANPILDIGRAVDGFSIIGNRFQDNAGTLTAITVQSAAANGIIHSNAFEGFSTDVTNNSATTTEALPLEQGGTGQPLVDPGADRGLFWDDSEGAIDWLAYGTGLSLSATTLSLSHLGFQNLTDPGADRIAFWDDSSTSFQWLVPSSNFSITNLDLDLADVPSLDGIAFPATQVPSADANTLDDYEEGTWTPVLTFATPGDLSVVYSQQIGRYIKIGKKVTLSARIDTSTFTHTTASGAVNVTGVPFASETVTNFFWNGDLAGQGVTKSGYTDFALRIGSNSSIMEGVAMGSGSGFATITAADMPTGGTVILFFGCTYEATD